MECFLNSLRVNGLGSEVALIIFTCTEEGDYSARVDDVEVRVGNRGFEIITFEDMRYIPCDDIGYDFKNSTAGECPDGRQYATCALVDNCPFEEVANSFVSSHFEGMLRSFEEVEAKVRHLLGNRRRDSDGPPPYKKPWPEGAAARFANEPWSFNPPLTQEFLNLG